MSSQYQVLLINCSPRPKSNTGILLDKAQAGVLKVKGFQTSHFELAGKRMEGCRGVCSEFCASKGSCLIKDDFAEFQRLWLEADGIIYGTPVYHMGPPAQIKCAIDRLGNVLFASLKKEMPRFLKPCGVIVQGSSRWGGQEITAQFFVAHSLLMNCLPVTGDMPMSYIGVLGYAPTWESDSILSDEAALCASENLGVRVAEVVKIITLGREACSSELPDVYWLERMRARLGESETR